MPAFSSLSVFDGQATPVAHTFAPMRLDQGENRASYADRVSGVAIGFPTVDLRLGVPKPGGRVSDGSRVYRARIDIALPVLETLGTADSGIAPPPTVAYTLRGQVEFILPERASLQNRKDILAYVKNVLNASVVSSMVQDLEAVY